MGKMEKLPKLRVKQEFKVAADALSLEHVQPNIIIQQLEENMKLREMPLEARLKKGFLK